jgi:hypothetical protein
MSKDEDLHATMWISATHEIEGNAPGIPTAGSSSGFSQYGVFAAAVKAVFRCGCAGASTATDYSLQQMLTTQARQEIYRGSEEEFGTTTRS